MAAKKKQSPEKPGVGHNSGISGSRLKSFIERVERLEEEKKAIGEDVTDVYIEAKSSGFDPKIMKKIVKLRKASKEKLAEEKELTALYLAAIGDSATLDAFE